MIDMVKITLPDGQQVSVQCCGKFEVEWALAHLHLWPRINRYDLRVAMEKRFDAAPEECRDWIRLAEIKLRGLDDANGVFIHPGLVPIQTFKTLRAANAARNVEWDPDAKINLVWRGNELAGEGGEAIQEALFMLVDLAVKLGKVNNTVKKLQRERDGLPGSRAPLAQLASELADLVICADLTAMQAGIDLMGQAVPDKFNETSEKVGLKTRLGK